MPALLYLHWQKDKHCIVDFDWSIFKTNMMRKSDTTRRPITPHQYADHETLEVYCLKLNRIYSYLDHCILCIIMYQINILVRNVLTLVLNSKQLLDAVGYPPTYSRL